MGGDPAEGADLSRSAARAASGDTDEGTDLSRSAVRAAPGDPAEGADLSRSAVRAFGGSDRFRQAVSGLHQDHYSTHGR